MESASLNAMTSCTSHETLLAEARLSSPPASRLTKHYALPGLERERRQFHEFVAVDLAHTTMLVEQGIVSTATGRAILEQLLAIRDMEPSDFPVDARKGSFLLQMESYRKQSFNDAPQRCSVRRKTQWSAAGMFNGSSAV